MIAWLTEVIGRGGPLGVFVLMLVENVFPPIPSEVILPLAGYVSARGDLSWTGAVIAGTAGSVAGSWIWFELGRHLGRDRLDRWIAAHGRWFAITPKEFVRLDRYFRRWGPWVLLVGRCVPGVRGVICIPAGVVGMSRPQFAIACATGSLIWCVVLVGTGRALGVHYAQVARLLGPVSTSLFLSCAVVYGYRVLTYRDGALHDAAKPLERTKTNVRLPERR